MAGTRLFVAVLLCGCGALAGAQGLDSVRGLVDSYQAAMLSAQKEPSRGHLEAAFNAIEPLRKALVLGRDGQRDSTLESLSEDEFKALRQELVGLLVNRGEVVFVEADAAFFERLAARGDRADRAFFKALHSTYPASVWPVYVEQQTDYSGCTRFGSKTLVSIYLTWTSFRRQYPRRYEDASRDQLDEVVRQATESTCACGDLASVEQELTEFRRRADSLEVRVRVEARLAAVRSDGAKIRNACKSG